MHVATFTIVLAMWLLIFYGYVWFKKENKKMIKKQKEWFSKFFGKKNERKRV